ILSHRPHRSTLFPYTTLFRSLYSILEVTSFTVDFLVEPPRTLLHVGHHEARIVFWFLTLRSHHLGFVNDATFPRPGLARPVLTRSEEHTSELQSRGHLVCRLL